MLHHVKEERDLAWLIDKGPHQPYIVLLTNNTFTKLVEHQQFVSCIDVLLLFLI